MKHMNQILQTCLLGLFLTLSCHPVLAKSAKNDEVVDLLVSTMNQVYQNSPSTYVSARFYADEKYIYMEYTLPMETSNFVLQGDIATLKQSALASMASTLAQEKEAFVEICKQLDRNFYVIMKDPKGSKKTFQITPDEIINEISANSDPVFLARRSLTLNAQNIKQSLPQQIDPNTIFEDVHYQNNTFYYVYKIVGLDEYLANPATYVQAKELITNTLNQNFVAMLGDPNMKAFVQMCITAQSPIVYQYIAADQSFNVTFPVEKLIQLMQ